MQFCLGKGRVCLYLALTWRDDCACDLWNCANLMAERLLKFVSIDPQTPEKRPASTRTADFHEIYGEFITQKANEQASRCSQCGVPFCQSGCPLQNNIPDWLKMTAEGRLEEAYALSSATNSMPEVARMDHSFY